MFTQKMAGSLKVVKSGRTWSIINRVTGELVDDGFFTKDGAQDALVDWSAWCEG